MDGRVDFGECVRHGEVVGVVYLAEQIRNEISGVVMF